MSGIETRDVVGREAGGVPPLVLSGVSPAGRWWVAPQVLVRRTTVPTRRLRTLRSAALEEVDAAARLRARLRTSGEALADELFEVIGENAGPGSGRGALVGVRRALHQGRTLRTREAAALTDLPSSLAGRVKAWSREAGRSRRSESRLDDALAAELTSDVPRLLSATADPAFRHALGLAAGALVDELDRLAEHPSRRFKAAKRARLVKFLARAATKASPYSSFLTTTAAPWTASSPAVPATPSPPWLRRQLDQAVVEALRAEVTRLAVEHGDALLRTNPTATPSGDGIELCTPGDEIFVRLRGGPDLTAWTELLSEPRGRPAFRRLEEVRRAADDCGLDLRGLDALLRAGLVEAFVPVDDLDPDPVGALHAWLTGLERPWARSAADRLAPLAEALSAPGRLDGGAGTARVARIVADVAPRDEAPESDAGTTPRPTVHEVLVGPRDDDGPRLEEWRACLDDLDVARRWLAQLSWKHPVRLTYGTWFGEHFGAGARVPLLTGVHVMRQELLRPREELSAAGRVMQLVLPPGAMPWFLDLAACDEPRLAELHSWQQAALARLRTASSGAREVTLDPGELAGDLAKAPPWLTGCPSVAAYVQPVPGGGAVLNSLHLGLGRGRTRHAALVGAGGTPVRRDAGPMHAELSGAFGSSMNARVPTLPFVVECHGAVTTRPTHERLLPGRLELRHDVATDLVRLWSPEHDREVVPHHVGMMGEMGLPPLATFLERVLSPSFVVHASVSLLGASVLPALDGLHEEPRVNVGRVTVQRRRWTVPAEQVPGRAGARASAEELLALADWRRELGLPDVCFFRSWRAGQHSLAHKGRKPLLVDFRNWYTIQVFLGEVAESSVVVLEEAHPDPLSPTAEDHVTELVVEIGDHPVEEEP